VSARAAVALLVVAAALAGCGLKGPLYLPERSQEIVVRPGTAAAPEAPAGTATGPATESAPPPGQPSGPQAPPPTVPEDSQARPPGSIRG
jgi:predicted small lipoprotein YifL